MTRRGGALGVMLGRQRQSRVGVGSRFPGLLGAVLASYQLCP